MTYLTELICTMSLEHATLIQLPQLQMADLKGNPTQLNGSIKKRKTVEAQNYHKQQTSQMILHVLTHGDQIIASIM